MRKAALTALLLAGICFAAAMPRADDGVFLGDGADIYPVEETGIRLDYEQLVITHTATGTYEDPKGSVRVEALFIFTNSGPAKTVTIGFPEELDHNPERPDEAFPTILNFAASVDGIPVRTVYQPLATRNEAYGFDRVYLWKVHFARGGSHVIRNSYDYKPSYTSNGFNYIRYILKTGSLWAGPIGRIDIIVRSPIPVSWMEFVPYPEEYSRFHGVNWEPDRDIELGYRYWRKGEIPREGTDVHIYASVDSGYTEKTYGEAAAARRAEIRKYIAGLKPEKLQVCAKQEIQAYINGIYAAHGRPFRDPEWAGFFAGKWWYQPDPSFGEELLTSEDQRVVARLKTYLAGALDTK